MKQLAIPVDRARRIASKLRESGKITDAEKIERMIKREEINYSSERVNLHLVPIPSNLACMQ